MPHLSLLQRHTIIVLHHQNLRNSEISRQVGCSKSSVSDIIQKFEETGTVSDRARSGRPRTARTVQNINACRREMRRGFKARSNRRMARIRHISSYAVSEIYNKDLKCRSLKCLPVQILTPAHKARRAVLARRFLRQYRNVEIQRLVFSDECVFHLDNYLNRQNKRIRGRSRIQLGARRLHERNKITQKLIVWAGISKLGKLGIHICPPNTKFTGAYYRQLIENHIEPELLRISNNGQYIFQQDGAPSHTAAETQALLSGLSSFIRKDHWPANSPDLNPMDYRIWAIMKQKVYSTRIRDLNHLRQRILTTWAEIPQRVIDSAIDEWRRRLRDVIQCDGGHIEHLYR